MPRRLTQSALPLLLAGLWVTACGHDTKAPSNQPPVVNIPTAQATDVSYGTSVALAIEATDPDGDALTYTWTQHRAGHHRHHRQEGEPAAHGGRHHHRAELAAGG